MVAPLPEAVAHSLAGDAGGGGGEEGGEGHQDQGLRERKKGGGVVVIISLFLALKPFLMLRLFVYSAAEFSPPFVALAAQNAGSRKTFNYFLKSSHHCQSGAHLGSRCSRTLKSSLLSVEAPLSKCISGSPGPMPFIPYTRTAVGGGRRAEKV